MKTAFRLMLILVLSAVLVSAMIIPTRSEARGATWAVEVFGNPNLVGPSLWQGVSPAINYNWGLGAPVINGVDTSAYGVPSDRFSVRFTSSVFFTAGNYVFTVQIDDGVRLYIDGSYLINDWVDGSSRTLQANYSFAADGNHTVTVEMYDSLYDAVIMVNWALTGAPIPTPIGGGGTGPGQPWYAEFFNSTDWSGAPVFTASYPASGLNLNWGAGSPGGALPADNFTARFTRTINVPAEMPAGYYIFYAQADDNFRFTVDVTLIMDHSNEFANSQTYSTGVTLLDGPHILKFEYRELSADASLFLTWYPPNGQNPQIPPPTGAVLPTAIPGEGTGGGGAAAPPPVPTGIRGRVMGNLRIRQQPTTASPKIGLMPWGTEVDLIGINGGRNWYMLNYNGTIGWSYAPWIWVIQGDANNLPTTDGGSLSGTRPPDAQQGVIVQAFGNMRIRTGPGLQYPRIDRAIWGSRVQLLARSANGLWYKIKYGDVVGWSYAIWYRAVQGDPLSVPIEG